MFSVTHVFLSVTRQMGVFSIVWYDLTHRKGGHQCCMSCVCQVEETQRAEPPAPWLSDRGSVEQFFDFLFINFCHILTPHHQKTQMNVTRSKCIFLCYVKFCDYSLCYSIMAPLIAEYDQHMDEMTKQLHKYQVGKKMLIWDV